ncbi:MAG: phage terminase large subunit [Hyphomicrobiales bacterium]|nr:phage terminase large subunit [Hyphomicrobiales bacterium]
MASASLPEFIWIWNQRQGLSTPALHLRIARWLEDLWQRRETAALLLAFRNSGKSTLVGLFCAWLLLGHPDLRILVLAAEQALARKMVRNVKRVIERHPLTPHLKPRRADQWASDQFTVNRGAELRDPSMLAKGIGANVTGSRADVVICDDVEVPNTCDTAAKREDLRVRLHELAYVLVPGGLQLYIGTPHTHASIYADGGGEGDGLLSGYRRLELPVLDPRGDSQWPERFPPDQIEAIRARTGPAKFAGQMLLRPVDTIDGRLDVDRLRFYGDALSYTEGNRQSILRLGGRRLVSASCWWDPAYGSPRGGDASVIAAVYTCDEGHYWLHRVAYLAVDPGRAAQVDEATQQCRQVVAFVRDLYLPSVTLETNGLGRFLPSLLRRELAAAGVRCAVAEVASTRAKDLRIVDAFDAVLAAERLHVHDDVGATPLLAEMREWRPGGKGRDDGVDAVAGCLASEPVRLPRIPPPDAARRPGADWRPGGAGGRARTHFEP